MNQKWQSLVLLLAVQSATAGAEQIYRWQDEAGRWHFAGEQSAPQSASPVTDEAAISVVKMKRLAEPPAAGGGDATNKKERQQSGRRKSLISFANGSVGVYGVSVGVNVYGILVWACVIMKGKTLTTASASRKCDGENG